MWYLYIMFSLIIDLKKNIMFCSKNNKFYYIASGDITGKIQDKKYYTPVGITQIKEKSLTNAKFGPKFLRFDFYRLSNNNHGKSNKPYMIHGPENSLINEEGRFNNGGYLSKGCIRLSFKDLDEIYSIIDIGDNVFIIPYYKNQNYDNTGKLSPIKWTKKSEI